MICYLFSAPTFFLFSSDVPALLYYAYIPITLITFFIGFYVYRNGENSLLNKIFFAICSLFSFWTIIALIEWTNINSNIITFVWSFSGIILGLIAILSIYFIYVFIDEEKNIAKVKIVFLSLLAPIFFLSPTNLNLKGFDITTCDAFKFEWLPFRIYYILLGIIAIVWVFVLLVYKYRISTPDIKRQIVIMGTGLEIFLSLFFLWTSYTYYLTQIGVLSDSRLEMYGLLGMMIFLIYISILMVRFKTFNTKLIATQVLIWGVIILVGSQFFFIQNNTNRILTAITLVGSIVMGFRIVRSVKKEVQLREKIETLVENLERANSNLKHININLDNANEKLKELDQLKTEFVGLATHQIRGPLTAIKGYLSMILEGDYGKVSKSIEDPVRIVFSSAESLSVIVSDFLNVSRIEQGQMKYNMEDCDIRELVEEVVKELKPNTESRGLEMRLDISSEPCIVHIDKEKIKQVINNLIDNSSKYTKEGHVSVSLRKEANSKILLAIKDTGVGISKATLPLLFGKFSRAKDAFKTNILGTGLGLYVARKMMEAHKGRVWAESEGEGKGSQFYVEFEAVK